MSTRIYGHGELLEMAEDRELSWEEIRKQARFCMATEISEDGTEWRDLQCPNCESRRIVCETPDLGVDARCYDCGHEFRITGNCWKLTKTFEKDGLAWEDDEDV